jgi:hypothetical protein
MLWLLVLLAITALTFTKLGSLIMLTTVLGIIAVLGFLLSVCALILALRRRG